MLISIFLKYSAYQFNTLEMKYF